MLDKFAANLSDSDLTMWNVIFSKIDRRYDTITLMWLKKNCLFASTI